MTAVSNFAFSFRYGSWWVRFPTGNSGGIQLKAPWCQVLFSERYGYKPVLVRLFGWRLLRLSAIAPRAESVR